MDGPGLWEAIELTIGYRSVRQRAMTREDPPRTVSGTRPIRRESGRRAALQARGSCQNPRNAIH
jgi:hypothetical protein